MKQHSWMKGSCEFLLLLAALAGCDRDAGSSGSLANPLTVAEDYARLHHPASRVPTGLERMWIVEDHGDIWTVEFTKQGQLGGGLRMTIRKRDMKVVDAVQTQ